ncbi:hypothetical protein AZE42_07880 [Rhizopogon vesiculosus]|uniref:Uncharacterized protein n=1 Tax=Rhizopogon vesiculosus TaxID=180088 RepID=A0A1J8QF45_9AGAM|nr:hypothetical protein AZE42_07880 [Rhizopogon vesiculosus]
MKTASSEVEVIYILLYIRMMLIYKRSVFALSAF